MTQSFTLLLLLLLFVGRMEGWMDGEWLKFCFFTNNRQFFLVHAPL
jgi:hypothetical protein